MDGNQYRGQQRTVRQSSIPMHTSESTDSGPFERQNKQETREVLKPSLVGTFYATDDEDLAQIQNLINDAGGQTNSTEVTPWSG